MPEGSRTHMGGTMRLGARRTLLQTVDCISAKLYQVPRRSSQWVKPTLGDLALQPLPTRHHLRRLTVLRYKLAVIGVSARSLG